MGEGGKRATDHLEPSAKKRGNERQLTKDDDLSDEDEVRRVVVALLELAPPQLPCHRSTYFSSNRA